MKRLEEAVSVKELAEKWNVNPKTIYDWVEIGGMPHYKVGRLVRFKPTEAQEWFDACKRNDKSGSNK